MARKATSFLSGSAILALAALPFTGGVANAATTYQLPTLYSSSAGTTWIGSIQLGVGLESSIDAQDLASALDLTQLTSENATSSSTTQKFTSLVAPYDKEIQAATSCVDSPVQVDIFGALANETAGENAVPLCLTGTGWVVNKELVAGAPDAYNLKMFSADPDIISLPAGQLPSTTPTPTATTPTPDPSPTSTTPSAEPTTPVPTVAPTTPVSTEDPTTPAPKPTTNPTHDANPTGEPTTPELVATADKGTVTVPKEVNPTTSPTGDVTEEPTPTVPAPTVTGTNTVGAKPSTPANVNASAFNVAGRFYKDVDKSGSFNAGDESLAGKTISLYSLSNNALAQQVKTDANGFYKFTNVPKGSYEMRWAADGAVGTLQQGVGYVASADAAVLTRYPLDLIDGDVTNADFGMIYTKGAAPKKTTPTTRTNPNATVFKSTPKKDDPSTNPTKTGSQDTTNFMDKNKSDLAALGNSDGPSSSSNDWNSSTGSSTGTSDSYYSSTGTSTTPTSGTVNSGALEGTRDGGLLAWGASFLGLGGLALRRRQKLAQVKND